MTTETTLWAVLSQGMANSQMEPWNNLWADLSQGMANSQMEPWNNLWADLSQGMKQKTWYSRGGCTLDSQNHPTDSQHSKFVI